MVDVRVSRIADFARLGERWRDLERRSEGSFFQSWTWVGCCAAERFPDAILVEAIDAGRVVALGLFNRVRRSLGPATLYLGESGTADLDSPYVEQNGILTEAGREGELTELCLRALVATYEVRLSSVGEPVLRAAQRAAPLVVTGRTQSSPFVDLAAARCTGDDYLASRSANTRAQVRRSDRYYRQSGPIALEAADSAAAAHAMLDRLAALHQATWRGRGQPGSFATPFFGHFHHALIDRGFPRGEVALLRVSCGETEIGFLYNFIWRGRMSAYQSGFAYIEGESRARPGLTSHVAAIRFALAVGIDIYDFLAGDDRYKRSLADNVHLQFWIEAGPFWSPRLLAGALRRSFR